MVGSINWRNTPIVESEQATLGDVECETAVSTPAVLNTVVHKINVIYHYEL